MDFVTKSFRKDETDELNTSTTYLSSLLGVIAEYNSNHAEKGGEICCSVQLVRVSSFRNDLLQNPYFNSKFEKLLTAHFKLMVWLNILPFFTVLRIDFHMFHCIFEPFPNQPRSSKANSKTKIGLQFTGKSLSEALILGLTNLQYDKRLLIDLTVHCMKTTSSEHVVYVPT